MNAFQSCRNTSDAVPLYLPQKLYLKPIARLNISLQLPRRTVGKTISNWEAMEKFRKLIEPEEFTVLKVTKTSLEFIRFEAEIDNKNKLQYVIDRLNNKMMKLKEFTELMHVRAAEAKSDFPSRHTWDAFFRESNDMDEMRPGERPDTVHISNLPSKWFVHPHLIDSDDNIIPSEKIFYRVFEKFGRIRHIDIPICDPYRKNMKAHMTGMQVSTFDETDFFEGYVQFKDYIGFSKTMDAFRNMKLLRKDSNDDCVTVNIKVDFDKTKHLCDASIRRREIVRERLVTKMREKELREEKERKKREELARLEREREEVVKTEKEKRRQERERKRKQKILAKLKINGADEITNKIAKEEKKLLKAQRKLEAIRLVEELFRRIKVKYEKTKPSRQTRTEDGDNELSRYKLSFETEVRHQRDRLHKAIEGRVILKSILSGGPRLRSTSSESLSSDSSIEQKKEKGSTVQQLPVEFPPIETPYPYPEWMRYQEGILPNPYAVGGYYPPAVRPPIHGYLPYQMRGRKFLGDMAGPSRGYPGGGGPFPRRSRGYNFRNRGANQRRNLYQLAQEEEYVKYFQKFLHEHDDRNHRDYSRSRSRSPSRRRSRSLSRRRSRSYSRRTRSYSRSRRSGSRRRRSSSRRRRRSESDSRRSRSSSRKRRSGSRKSRSPSRSRSRRRSYSKRSRSRDSKRSRKSSISHTPRTQTNRSKSKDLANEDRQSSDKNKGDGSEEKRSGSVDSSKFISPRSMRKMRSRSKSWSMPRETENGKRTRSWSSSPVNKDL